MRKSLALVLFAIAGCGNGTGAVDDFINTVAQQQCEWEFRCCTDAEIMSMDGAKFSDQDGCVPYHALTLMDQLYIDRLAVSEGRLRVDQQAAADCLIQLNNMVCNPAPGQPAPMMDPMAIDPCTKVFVGNTAAGSECIYANECVTGAHCVSDTLTVGRGVCVPYEEEGDICNGDADCDPNVAQLYCSQADYKCHVRAQLGEACMFSGTSGNPTLPLLVECDTRLDNIYCDPNTNTCTQLPGNGQPCLNPLPPGAVAQCNNDPTLQLVCDHSTGGTSGTCRSPGQRGDSCQQIACAKGLYCDTQSGDFCADLPGFGDSCEQTDACQMPYYCNFQQNPPTCDQPASVGESCASATCDTGLYCVTNTRLCATQKPVGASCASSSECQSLDCGISQTGGGDVCLAGVVGVQCIGR